MAGLNSFYIKQAAMSITYKSCCNAPRHAAARDTLFETFGVAPDEELGERAPQAESASLASAPQAFVIPHNYASMQSGGRFLFPTGYLIAKDR